MNWNTTEPPKDATPIVAVGHVIWKDEFSASSDPFCAAIFWSKRESGYEGWCYWHNDNLSVATGLDQEVYVDFWAEYPKGAGHD